jgi:hypothetical protein
MMQDMNAGLDQKPTSEDEIDPALVLALDVLGVALECVPPEMRRRVLEATRPTFTRHLERRFSTKSHAYGITPSA